MLATGGNLHYYDVRSCGLFPGFTDGTPGALRALLLDQVELLTLIRDAGITSAQVRALAELSPAARQAVVDLIASTARTGR